MQKKYIYLTVKLARKPKETTEAYEFRLPYHFRVYMHAIK